MMGGTRLISLLASRIEVLTDAEQIGLRVKAFIGGSGAERAVAIQQSVAGASEGICAEEVSPSSVCSAIHHQLLGRYCHEHDVASYMAPDAASLKKGVNRSEKLPSGLYRDTRFNALKRLARPCLVSTS
jgi:hypothetical protein